MNRNTWFVGLAMVGMLSACVGQDIDHMRQAEGSGDTFTKSLTEEYKEFTVFEADEMYDWADAGHFARKGLRAANGEVVEPEPIADWSLPDEHVNELTSARSRLVSALGPGRDAAPETAARAQGRFDCWIEQQEENHQPDHIAACRDEFFSALAMLEKANEPEPEPETAIQEAAQMAPESFIVYFDFDSSAIDAQGQSVIRNALAKAGQMGNSEFSVTGHADRAGAEDYNMALSLKRANEVRSALVGGGASEGGISVAGRGEGELAVPTADGVREPGNRRVEIILQ